MGSELQAQREQQASSAGQLEQLRRERDEMSKRLAVLAEENAALKDDADRLTRLREEVAQSNAAAQVDATQSVAKSWLERVSQLKQRMEQTPNARIPELQFLTEQDWLDAARGKLETERDYRKALASLRNAGENAFVSIAQPALREYMEVNGGQFPTELSQLQPYFKSPVDEAILQRYEIQRQGSETRESDSIFLYGEDWVIGQKGRVDPDYDTRHVFGRMAHGVSSPSSDAD
ncbi:MAG TPA: hypothetical protein VLZ12_08405 [Verrucomicrobiae bacterium]|nr:hypothetical protein [Verrucomicrobiae bacterium]